MKIENDKIGQDIKIKYNQCRRLINDADVLLFHHGNLPSIGWFIGKYTNSLYSHAGLAHWHKDWDKDRLMCLEFREFHGSRECCVSDYIKAGYQIDVFRACPVVHVPYVDLSDPDFPVNKTTTHHFTKIIAKNLIDTAHGLLGKSYSYWTIWQLIKTFIPFIRLKHRPDKNGEPDTQKFVCSTLVSYSYRLNYIDPVPYLPDAYTTPGDLARSSLFIKLFQII